MVPEGTRSVAAGRISLSHENKVPCTERIRVTMSMLCPWLLPAPLSFLNKLGTHMCSWNSHSQARSKHDTGFVLILVSNPISATYYLLCYLWPCCVSYFTSVVCASLKWVCQHTVEVNVSKNTGPTDLFNMMDANKTHSKACCSCTLGPLGGNSLMKGRTLRRVLLGSLSVEGRGRRGQRKQLGCGSGPVKTLSDLSQGALQLGWVCRIVASWGEKAGPSPFPWLCCQLFDTVWSWTFSSAKGFSKEGWKLRIMAAFPEIWAITVFWRGIWLVLPSFHHFQTPEPGIKKRSWKLLDGKHRASTKEQE